MESFDVRKSNTMISEEHFIKFKKRYGEFKKHHEVAILERFKQDYQRFTNSYQVVKNLVDELNRKEAQEFNVFSILDRGHLEVLTHTPFLADLLNPTGTHGQKNLFLRLFLMQVLEYPESEASDKNWFVAKESEYVDLKIVNYSLREAIFIENKIYTGAHSGQLSRYYRVWKDGYFKGNGAFIYLTLHGGAPNISGFDPDEIYEKAEILEQLICLCYKMDIHDWLEKAIPHIEAPRVEQTVKQYTDLIKAL